MNGSCLPLALWDRHERAFVLGRDRWGESPPLRLDYCNFIWL